MTIKEYLDKYEKAPGANNSYKGWEQDLEDIKTFNKNLIEKYPWIIPINDWSGKRITDCVGSNGEEGFWPGDPKKHPEYDYEYTLLDDMPNGWRIAFGDQMVEEIHQELIKYNYVNDYKVVQIKEKYGGLRWYDNGTPVGKLSEEYREVSTQGTPWYPSYDKETEYLEETGTDHYISFYDRKNVDMTDEEIDKYNLNAIHHFRIYKIIEKCKIPDIISKYEQLSYKTCIRCGKPAEWERKGWISPYCTNCANFILDTEYKNYKEMWKDKPERLKTLERGALEKEFIKLKQ